jgi:squalene-hopene/tetraprenyl-beta-curcumene cyclase
VAFNWANVAIERGIGYLLDTQRPDGTGFPGHFYLKYHFYQQYFPLLALGRYQQKVISH